jgi:twitching motility protein PilT
MEHTDAAAPAPAADAPAREEERTEYGIDELLEIVVERDASDLHITAGTRPVIRVTGRLERLGGFARLMPEQTRRLLYSITSTEQQKELEVKRQIDLSYPLPGLARFRVNVYFQRQSLAAAFRLIPSKIKSLDELNMPTSLYDLAHKPRGLVLVTGPTGSGKSTTLAAMIDEVNKTRSDHIVTIEDPIEFLHAHKGCIVNQREIGPDATGFGDALRAALRQDPDVILLGEMRDLETIATALTAAETGHLVFGTVHTQDAPSSIDRLIDVFPAAQQGQIRVQVASTLQGVVTQNLVPRTDGRGRVPACEILIPDDAVRNLIRQGKVEQIYSVMQTGSQKGMQTMEQSLVDLVLKGVVTQEMALSRSSRPGQLLELIQRGRGGGGRSVSPLQQRLRTAEA